MVMAMVNAIAMVAVMIIIVIIIINSMLLASALVQMLAIDSAIHQDRNFA
jgi:hypothetical protein